MVKYLSILFFTLFLFGCLETEEEKAEKEANEVRPPSSLQSLVTVSNSYKNLLESMTAVPDFVAAEPFEKLSIGSFLRNRNEIGGSSGNVSLDIEAAEFHDFSHHYALDLKDEGNVETSSLGVIPGVAGIAHKSKNIENARFVDYSLSFSNVSLSKLKSQNLKEYIAAEFPQNSTSDSLVYGVYTADINISFSVLDHQANSLRQSGVVLNELMVGASDFETSTKKSEGFESAIKSKNPVIIAYLIRGLTPSTNAVQNLRVEKNSNNDLDISWDPVSGASFYRLYWSDGISNLASIADSDIAQGLAYVKDVTYANSTSIGIDTNLKRYYIAVVPIINGQPGDFSDIKIYELGYGLVTDNMSGVGIPEPDRNAPIVKEVGSTRFHFYGCNRDFLTINCFLEVVNIGVQNDLNFDKRYISIIDSFNETTKVNSAVLGKKGLSKLNMLPNLPVELTLQFTGLLSGIENLPLLSIGHYNGGTYNAVEFSAIEFYATRDN